MASLEGSRVFISYARRDGADLAHRLRHDLCGEGLTVWLDSREIEGGESWTVAIESAIDETDVTLALLTAGSYQSEICRAEQLRSLRKGKCVIPLLAQSGTDIPLHLEATNYRDFTEEPYAERLRTLVADIEARNGIALREEYKRTRVTYVTAPPMVANYVERPQAVRALRDVLFAPESRRAIAAIALEGMGGVGKTVLARALCEDEVVQQAFPDGIVWIPAGRQSHVTTSLREVAKALGDDASAYNDDLASKNRYRTTIANKAVLVVIDDVWSTSDLEPYLAESPRSRFLFTTRDAGMAKFTGARRHRLDLFDDRESLELLALWAETSSEHVPPEAVDIVRECARLPLALSMIGALLRGASAEDWKDTLELLRRSDFNAIAEQLPLGQESFFRAVEVSVNALTQQMQDKYTALAVLLEDMSAPIVMLQTLWGVDEVTARRIGRHFVDRSLAQQEAGDRGGIHLHDLQLDYVRAQSPHGDSLPLINGALRLGAHIIAKDPTQFASQMTGRLLPHATKTTIGHFLTSIAVAAPRPWLRPLNLALLSPGGPLTYTLTGHSGSINDVAMSADWRLGVSASADGTLKVWNMISGRELRTLKGHSASVNCVAVSADGRRVLSGSSDGALKVWDLDAGRELRTLEGYVDVVTDVTMSADGRRAVSADRDGPLTVWDLITGRKLCVLEGHSTSLKYSSGTEVQLSADGRRAVSARWGFSTLKIWDIDAGRELRTLDSRSGWVNCIAVSADGRRAVSASGEGPLKVWDVDAGRELCAFDGASGSVTAVAMSADGRRTMCAFSNGTIRVWEVDERSELCTLRGLPNSVRCVALSADGQRAASGEGDGTLQIWKVHSDPEPGALQGHSARVQAISVSADGHRAVAASEDGTLRVWDVDARRELYMLKGHSGGVNDVAISADGQRAVSVGNDDAVRVWSLDTRRELRTLKGFDSVGLSPDGHVCISRSNDRTLRVWSVDSGRELRTLKGQSDSSGPVEISADGRRAVSASYSFLRVWDIDTGRELRTLGSNLGFVSCVALDADGRRAVSGSHDGTLRVWDTDTARELHTLKHHSAIVNDVAVSINGRWAVSVSTDRALKVWGMGTGEALVTLTFDGVPLRCAFAGPTTIVACDVFGLVHFLDLELRVH
jgi:WD40 repeat protein